MCLHKSCQYNMPPPQSFKVSTIATFRHTYIVCLIPEKMFPSVFSCKRGWKHTHVDTYGNNMKWKLPLFVLVHILLPPSKWKFIYPFTFCCCLVMLVNMRKSHLPPRAIYRRRTHGNSPCARLHNHIFSLIQKHIRRK